MATDAGINVLVPEGVVMTKLTRNALARAPLSLEEVETVYRETQYTQVQRLCETIARHRCELEGVGQLLADMENAHNEIASVLSLMDNHANVWGDEGVFRRCRDRLRALLPKASSFSEGKGVKG